MIVCTAFTMWKALGLWTESPSPIVVVLSGSMEPIFHRGDLLVLSNRKKLVDIGDVVVYNVKGRDIPIVHRVIKQHTTTTKEKQYLLTKGDNNPTDDVELYARGQTYLDRQEEIIGLVEGFVPHVGMVTIWMNEIKWIKYSIVGGLGLLAILQREG
jgi:signal peptidase I